jgi:beta-lactamase class A
MLVVWPASAQNTLDSVIKAKIAGFQGRVSIYAKNLQTGATYSLDGADAVRTASTIKLAIMAECFFERAEGKLNFDQQLELTTAGKVTGSGVLDELSSGVKLPIRDLIHLMIVVSDNTATNLILNRVSGEAVNTRMASLGLTETRVMRNILGAGAKPTGFTQEGRKPENAKWGTGRSSPREMVTLLDMLYRGKLVDKAASDEMLAILKRQQLHSGIARDLPNLTVASKSGALDHLRSDVGIVYTPKGDVAMAITVDDIPEVFYSDDNPGSLLISKLSSILLTGLIAK